MSDFFFVTSWQFYAFPVADISWIIQLLLIPNLYLHTVLLCSLSSGICSKSLPVSKLFTSGLKVLTSGRILVNLFEQIKVWYVFSVIGDISCKLKAWIIFWESFAAQNLPLHAFLLLPKWNLIWNVRRCWTSKDWKQLFNFIIESLIHWIIENHWFVMTTANI